MWSWFWFHKFKMMTSRDALFNFRKFWFSGLLGVGGKRAKNSPKWQKYSVWLRIPGTVLQMIVAFGTHVQNDISSNFFFFFFNLFIYFFSFFQNSGFLGFSNFINKCQKEFLRCAPPSSNVCDFYYFCFYLLEPIIISTCF